MDRIIKILTPYIDAVKKLYGDSLHNIILFGSYARGEETLDSDIDLLILLNTKNDFYKFNDLSAITAEFNVINNTFIQEFTLGYINFKNDLLTNSFYQTINEEGVIIYGDL